MGHDQRFKEFLHAFLRDFLKLFLPDVERRLDFQSLEFLDTGVFTDRPEGMPREADVVAKLVTRDGDPELVLIHVEVQLRPERDFQARMFEYYSLLRSRYRLPVLPIAVYLRGGRKGLGTEEYRVKLFECDVLRFRYDSIHLARLSVEEYGERGGPPGAGLAALMKRSASRDVERLRASLMRRVVPSELDEARQFILIIIDFIQTHFGLTAEQMARYRRLVSRKEYHKVQDVELTWADKVLKQGEEKGIEKGLKQGIERGLEQGLEKGREAGLLEGKREALLHLLATKFGALPEWAMNRVQAIETAGEVNGPLERVIAAASLEEMGL